MRFERKLKMKKIKRMLLAEKKIRHISMSE